MLFLTALTKRTRIAHPTLPCNMLDIGVISIEDSTVDVRLLTRSAAAVGGDDVKQMAPLRCFTPQVVGYDSWFLAGEGKAVRLN